MKIIVMIEEGEKFNHSIELPKIEAMDQFIKIVASLNNALAKSLRESMLRGYGGNSSVHASNAVDYKTQRAKEEALVTAKNDQELIKSTVKEPLEQVDVARYKAATGSVKETSKTYTKLVIAECPRCGNVAAPIVIFKDGEIDHKNDIITCRSCQEDLKLEDLKTAKYVCPNCETKAEFYAANGLKEVKCKHCKSNIDLIWHEKKKQYIGGKLI